MPPLSAGNQLNALQKVVLVDNLRCLSGTKSKPKLELILATGRKRQAAKQGRLAKSSRMALIL